MNSPFPYVIKLSEHVGLHSGLVPPLLAEDADHGIPRLTFTIVDLQFLQDTSSYIK